VDDPFARDRALELLLVPQPAYQLGLADREAGYRKVEQALTAAKADQALLLRLKGSFLVRSAWDARGDGIGITVTPEGWKLFTQRLEQADEALRQSWKLDPNSEETALNMIAVCMGRGLPREEMEIWFERAMKANGNSLAACRAKMEYLDPKWH